MSQFIEMFGGLCQDTPWSDVVTITNGKAYPEEYQEEGAYPICGSGGIMCYGEKKLYIRHDQIRIQTLWLPAVGNSGNGKSFHPHGKIRRGRG